MKELALAEYAGGMNGAIMANPEMRIELRRHPRYLVQYGAIAVLSCDSRVQLGLVADISKGGLAFSYIDHHLEPGIAPGEFAQMRITWHEKGFCLHDVDCQVVMEQELKLENTFSMLPMKKCRVRFSTITTEQMLHLDDLLDSL